MTHALQPRLLLQHQRLTADRGGTTHALISLKAEGRPDLARPPLDLVACLDVSGSMSGRKLEEVKQSVLALSRELGAQDRLGVTSFETEVRQVLPPTRMDDAGKARLRAAVLALAPMGSTCMSGGLVGALTDLEAAPPAPPDAVRRVLLFTDGHANHGIPEQDRGAWSALLKERVRGASVSWFGFGEDHDAEFLAFLADQSHGNAYVAKDADAISDAFARELGGLMGIRAMEITLELRASHGAALLLNDERSTTSARGLVARLDDLACEERKELVIELTHPALADGEVLGLTLLAKWRDVVTGLPQETVLEAHATASPGAPDAANPEVLEAMALVFAANAQKAAWTFADQGRLEDAQRVLREAIERLAQLGTPRAVMLANQLGSLLPDYAEGLRFRTSRSKLKSAERTMSRQRSSGSDMDQLFETNLKANLVKRFKSRR